MFEKGGLPPFFNEAISQIVKKGETMGSKQYRAFGKSVLSVSWFYGVNLIGGYLITLLTQNPNTFLKMHGQLYTLLIYGVIFIGIYGTSKDQEVFHQALRGQSFKVECREVGLYIAMGIGVYVASLGINHLFYRFFTDYAQIQEGFSAYEPILRFLAMVVAPALVEEYLFRFKIQNWMKEGFGVEIAIVGQALLFGMVHTYRLQQIYAVLCGICFGIVREKKGLKATLWMHLTVNAIGWTVGSFWA